MRRETLTHMGHGFRPVRADQSSGLLYQKSQSPKNTDLGEEKDFQMCFKVSTLGFS